MEREKGSELAHHQKTAEKKKGGRRVNKGASSARGEGRETIVLRFEKGISWFAAEPYGRRKKKKLKKERLAFGN